MTETTILPSLAAGLMSGGAVLLVTVGVALLYEHGRYVPLWLPDLGVLGAYLFHALWTWGVPPAIGAVVTFAVAALFAWGFHVLFIAPFLESKDYLSPLLVGLGLSQMIQGTVSLYGHGMSQHYPDTVLAHQGFTALGVSIHWVDVAFYVATAVGLVAIHLLLTYTRCGLQVRAVMDNPDWAKSLELPVRRVDALVLATAAALACSGAVMRGVRYDLQPSMMFYPGLVAVVACVTAGSGRRILAVAVVVAIEIVAGLMGSSPAVSALQRAVPFVLLVVVLLARPLLRRGGGLPAPAGTS